MPFSTFNAIQSFIIRINNIVLSYIYNFPNITTDASLALYYPLDICNNLTTPNYASGLPVYDASMNGSLNIINKNNYYVTGLGDLSLNNTMGSSTSNYVVSNQSFNLVPTRGLSISCWFSCSGQLNTIGTLVSLTNKSTGKTIELDICRNILYSSFTIKNIPLIYSTNTNFLLWIDATDSTNFTYSSSNIINSVKNLGYNTTPMAIGGNPNNITYLSSNSFTTTPCIQLGSYSSSPTNIITNITDINNKKELTFFYVIAYDTTFSQTSDRYVQLYGPEGSSVSNFENTFCMISNGTTTSIILQASEQGASNNNNASNFDVTVSSVPNKFHIVSFTTSILGGGQRIGFDGNYSTLSTGYPGGGASNLNNIISSTIHFDGIPQKQNVVYIKEVLGFTTSFSLTQIQQMEGYLAWKWGLQTNLPSTHPYYASAPQPIPNLLTSLPLFTNSRSTTTITSLSDLGTNSQTINIVAGTDSGVAYQGAYKSIYPVFFDSFISNTANNINFNFIDQSKFTISLWVLIGVPNYDLSNFFRINNGTSDVLVINASNSTNNVSLTTSGLTITTSYTKNTSFYIAFTVNKASGITLYKNGVSVGSANGTITFTGTTFTAFLQGYGQIFNFKYYNYILTSTEITTLYDAEV